ncbi:MAG: tRNA 4-thiouridine(8) synthase ThiI [Desulfobacterales bacterium]
MTRSTRQARGLGLCSGGLDSMLAGLLLQHQGIDVHWVSFETPFFSSDKARAASLQTGIPLMVRNITPMYVEMLKAPPAGFGKNMNPCMDCHTLMFRVAGEIMRSEGFDFLFSGEVLGQRPMSQTRPSLRYVEKHSGLTGYILRPLCAKRLAETLPEQAGVVDRNRLLDLSGRSRKAQIALAREFGITDYPAPAGGCLLTDPAYSKRLRDLFDHGHRLDRNELELLKYGRHFRLENGVKIVVGRTRKDNQSILRHADPGVDTVVKMRVAPGPTVLIPNHRDAETVQRAAEICAGYSKLPDGAPAEVLVTSPRGEKTITVLPVSPASVKPLMI